jgi:Tfp pilus assembly protein PilE
VLTIVELAVLVAVTALLIGFAAGAAYGGRHTNEQSKRADAAVKRAKAAETLAALHAQRATRTAQQLADYRNALGHRAGRKQAGRG